MSELLLTVGLIGLLAMLWQWSTTGRVFRACLRGRATLETLKAVFEGEWPDKRRFVIGYGVAFVTLMLMARGTTWEVTRWVLALYMLLAGGLMLSATDAFVPAAAKGKA